jgi:hypothetical protein
MHIAAHNVSKTKLLSAAAAGYCRLAIVGAVLVTGAVMAAKPSTATENRSRGSLLTLAASSVEAEELEPTVASGALFQRSIQLECNQNFCKASFPPMQQNQQLVVQFVSCRAFTTVAHDISSFLAAVDNRSTTIFSHFLGPIFETNGGTLAQLSQQIVLTVTAGRSLGLAAFSKTGRLSFADCRVSGVRQTLN